MASAAAAARVRTKTSAPSPACPPTSTPRLSTRSSAQHNTTTKRESKSDFKSIRTRPKKSFSLCWKPCSTLDANQQSLVAEDVTLHPSPFTRSSLREALASISDGSKRRRRLICLLPRVGQDPRGEERGWSWFGVSVTCTRPACAVARGRPVMVGGWRRLVELRNGSVLLSTRPGCAHAV